MWRHGDIVVAAVPALPAGAVRQSTKVLAWGEVTGHSHRLEDPETGSLFSYQGVTYVQVTGATARLIHEEHKPITLPQGVYRYWHQREYTPQAIRRVVD